MSKHRSCKQAPWLRSALTERLRPVCTGPVVHKGVEQPIGPPRDQSSLRTEKRRASARAREEEGFEEEEEEEGFDTSGLDAGLCSNGRVSGLSSPVAGSRKAPTSAILHSRLRPPLRRDLFALFPVPRGHHRSFRHKENNGEWGN